MNRVETVEEFLARGGQVERIPRGAMKEAGWTSSEVIRFGATGQASQVGSKPPTPPESVPVTGVHRVPNQARHEQPEPRSASAVTAARATRRTHSPNPRKAPHNNGRDGSKTRALLDAMGTSWSYVAQLAKASGLPQDHCSARLAQLRNSGQVISHGQRPYMLWARPGTELPTTPAASALPPGEFDGVTTLQLLDKSDALRQQIREAQRLLVRIDRQVKLRKRLARGA